MTPACPNKVQNARKCACTYAGCPRHGACCECLQYHLASKQLPACCFTPEAEATYDRSFKMFIQTWK
jgi:hypothetical protein